MNGARRLVSAAPLPQTSPLLAQRASSPASSRHSAIFTHSPEQLAAAKAKISALEASGKLRGPVVTQLADAAAHTWYVAEGYHQGCVTAGYSCCSCAV